MSDRDEKVALCKRFYDEVFGAGRVDVIDELVTPGFVDHEELGPDMPGGIEGVKLMVGMFRSAFPDLVVEPTMFVVEGDLVASHIRFSGTHRGEFMGLAPTGRRISITAIDIIRLQDGKAAEHWGVSDMMSLMQQLGALEG